MCPELGSQSSYTIWATRYDNRTSKCYMTGQVGPCGKNMIFYSLPNDLVYGECDCNYDIECKSLIYSHVYDQCFYAYEQVKYINPLFSNALTLNTHHIIIIIKTKNSLFHSSLLVIINVHVHQYVLPPLQPHLLFSMVFTNHCHHHYHLNSFHCSSSSISSSSSRLH